MVYGVASTLSSNRAKYPDIEPLRVRPNKAMVLLDCGRTELYGLIDSGEIDSYRDGGARWIITRSIHAYNERKLEQAKQQKGIKKTAQSI